VSGSERLNSLLKEFTKVITKMGFEMVRVNFCRKTNKFIRVAGMKSGFGKWTSLAGDYYEGMWINNKQQGRELIFTKASLLLDQETFTNEHSKTSKNTEEVERCYKMTTYTIGNIRTESQTVLPITYGRMAQSTLGSLETACDMGSGR
jgi:hypothetical protein